MFSSILNIIDLDKYFLVCIDSCKGLGGVITENGHVICYESRNIKGHEKNYVACDLEISTIVLALKMWINYLMGRKFELRIDCNGLKYLFEQKTSNSRKARWLEFLSEYDFDIKQIRGKENKFDDALNKRMHVSA